MDIITEGGTAAARVLEIMTTGGLVAREMMAGGEILGERDTVLEIRETMAIKIHGIGQAAPGTMEGAIHRMSQTPLGGMTVMIAEDGEAAGITGQKIEFWANFLGEMISQSHHTLHRPRNETIKKRND